MIKNIALLLIIITNSNLAQTKIINETIENNKYVLFFSENSISKKKIATFVHNSIIDSIPFSITDFFYKDIFIAIPSKVIKEILYEPVKIRNTNLPQINKSLSSLLIHNSNNKNIINEEILYQNNELILHLKVNLFQDITNKSIKYSNEFKITILFDNAIDVSKRTAELNKGKLKQNNYNFGKFEKKYLTVTSDEWINYNNTYLKIGVNENDIYRVYYEDLLNLGINPSNILPDDFKLFSRGIQIPIFVDGSDDGQFDDGDFIEFFGGRNFGGKHRELSGFGEPYNEYLNRYSDTTVYWITWDNENSLRANTFNEVTGNFVDTLDYYYEINHFERDNWYDYSIASIVRRQFPFFYENETWVEGQLRAGGRARKDFQLDNIYPNENAYLFAKLQNFASEIQQNAHLLGHSINSIEDVFDSTYIDRYEKIVLIDTISSSLLEEGTNSLYLHSFETNAVINSVATDWYEIEYPRFITFEDNRLFFTFPHVNKEDRYLIEVSRITSDDIVFWKKDRNKYSRFLFEPNSDSFIIEDSVNSRNEYMISISDSIKKPIIYYKKQFKNLRNNNNQSNYIAITHDKFESKVEEYLDFIKNNYNLNTKLINIFDIYDEFSFGFFNPEAIKEFIKSVDNNWAEPKPEYLFLVGGTTYDYYGNKNKNQGFPRVINYVPSFGEPISDNWFVSLDSSDVFNPIMKVGRLPVREVDQLDWYFQKHKTYVSQPYNEWNKTFMFFSGGIGNNESEIRLLREVNNEIIDTYATKPPLAGLTNHFFKTVNPTTNFGPFSNEEVQNVIDKGAIFISYLGHSGTRTWDNSITEAFQLENNVERYPMVTDFGCSTVKFAEPDVQSFSELFTLDAEGQALLYIGNTSLGFVSSSTTFPKLFYKKILKDTVYNVAKALNDSKIEFIKEYGNSQVNQLFALTNSLIGDPIISLKLPEKPNLLISNNMVNYDDQPSDNIDSLEIKINYANLGLVDSLLFEIKARHFYNNDLENELTFLKELPLRNDSLTIFVPVRNKAGEHIVEINLDSQNNIVELDESDNEVSLKFNVSSSAFRSFLVYEFENTLASKFNLLNPTSFNELENIRVEISESRDFINPIIISEKVGNVISSINLSQLVLNRRYWMRTFDFGVNNFGNIETFIFNNENKYMLSDSISFSNSSQLNLEEINSELSINKDTTNLKVLSGGFSDGSTAVISKNGINFVPSGELRGHHICLFNKDDLEFSGYEFFDVHLGHQTVLDSYTKFLDTLSDNFFVAIAITDEGRVNDTELKEKIKQIGSTLIDSVGFRFSWSIIGYKGAIPGSVPEAFSSPTFGSVTIDTTLIKDNLFGELNTSLIGPVAEWEKIVIDDSEDKGISYYPIVRSLNSVDTLSKLNFSNGVADISSIDAKQYPYMNLMAKFKRKNDGPSPKLNSIGISYKNPPELATNFQVVSIEDDSLRQGENLELNFDVYNVGETPADSFFVKVDLVNENNILQKNVFRDLVASIDSMDHKSFQLDYNTVDLVGNYKFNINIDTENKITEFYEDNNFFSIPFYVQGDTTTPTFNVTFDDEDIFDGEYITSTPNIKIELTDPSLVPITDTATVNLFLNGNKINSTGNQEIINYSFSSSNPKVTVNYNPVLEDGEYELTVFAKDASDNIASENGYSKKFVVNNETKILNVYNYPNPFNDDTHFTFMLTQIPEEVKIKIYTIAGRLIKQIELSSDQLDFDFNKIYWDGRDEDGDLVGNGVYLYKVIMKDGDKSEDITQKLAIVR